MSRVKLRFHFLLYLTWPLLVAQSCTITYQLTVKERFRFQSRFGSFSKQIPVFADDINTGIAVAGGQLGLGGVFLFATDWFVDLYSIWICFFIIGVVLSRRVWTKLIMLIHLFDVMPLLLPKEIITHYLGVLRFNKHILYFFPLVDCSFVVLIQLFREFLMLLCNSEFVFVVQQLAHFVDSVEPFFLEDRVEFSQVGVIFTLALLGFVSFF